MFTGLVEDLGTIVSVRPQGQGRRLAIRTKIPLAEVALGDSIAVNGVCLTAERCEGDIFEAVAGRETLERSNLVGLAAGHEVHLERALCLGDRLGGHIVQGHVDGLGSVQRTSKEQESYILWVKLPRELERYTVAKGSLCVDGVSLTINEISGGAVRLNIVPHTWFSTRLKALQVGEHVNIEVDILAKYVERLLTPESGGRGMTAELLKGWGY